MLGPMLFNLKTFEVTHQIIVYNSIMKMISVTFVRKYLSLGNIIQY